ncbi:uncharacterized protein N7503_009010 [Penicillium pulvis]|uniref:uncharacterized protein n=1 Tax=Penicillium pulvis TaxID=1562058 RepID=UPI002546F0F7|nr:uncharacterized protein N7503_009010 [Penicillium pulvis]KAJ5793032.1 hypothetical protein N7503_009010 [Penicillium pulvis]
MQSTGTQLSPVKDGRRILGEKDTNACLSPAHQNKQSLPVTGTPVKRALFSTVSPKKLLPSPMFAGQKRTRDQVDETEENGPVQTRGSPIESSVKNVSPKQNQELDMQDTRVATPPRSERDQNQHMDTQSPTASNQEARTIPDDPDARKIFIQEKAALLRNTLQTAMRNVTDHQIDRRVSDLEEHSRKCPRVSMSILSSSPLPQLSFCNTTTPKFTTPRIGSMPDMSSTPCHQTPDLPRRRSPLANAERVKASQRTPPRTLGSPMQLSSPPATVIRHNRTRDVEESRDANREGLSPSQRGDAVDGLLKLMSTADQRSSADAWSG